VIQALQWELARYELAAFEWKTNQPLLPNKPCGIPRADDRRVLNGIFWSLRSGSPSAESCAFTSRRPPKKPAGGACTGRSRGGATTKLQLRVIGNGLPTGADVIADRRCDADWIRDLIADQNCKPHIPPMAQVL
jgi:hypothetical protein